MLKKGTEVLYFVYYAENNKLPLFLFKHLLEFVFCKFYPKISFRLHSNNIIATTGSSIPKEVAILGVHRSLFSLKKKKKKPWAKFSSQDFSICVGEGTLKFWNIWSQHPYFPSYSRTGFMLIFAKLKKTYHNDNNKCVGSASCLQLHIRTTCTNFTNNLKLI